MLKYKNIIEDSIIEHLSVTDKEEIPVIICGKDCLCDDLEKHVLEMGGRVKYILPLINAVAAYIPTVGVKSMAMKDITEKIYLDDHVHKLMDTAPITVGSDFANEYGLTGKNVSIAVLDTGVFPHEDLTTPHNRIIGFKDFIKQKEQSYDGDGHGTHVAGIAAGNGFSSRGKYMGIAPDANIVSVKVLKDDGSGNISDVIAGIQWVINNRDKYNIKIITLSLGTKAKSRYKDDLLCQAVDAAVTFNITVTVAAGNSGPDPSTIASPAISPNVITVGTYGRLVIIDHENGYQTYYAHNSKNLVKRGERVYKGQKIAEMGSTGRSTGVHLHFEVRKNGTPINPRKFVKY